MALNGDPLGGWGQFSLSPTHSAWIAWQFAEAWRYSLDEEFLRERAAPFCFAVGEGLLALLEETPDGTLRLPLSTSPEYGDNTPAAWLTPNSNYDAALLHALFESNAELAEALGDDTAAAVWSRARAHLDPLDVEPPDSAHPGALTIARDLPYAESHRHLSHTLAVYPLGTLSTPDSQTARATIDATLDAIEAAGTRAWVGYSFAWAAALSARAGRPERALEHLEDYLCFTGPNGFHLNGAQCDEDLSDFRYRPFTLEGNFMAMDAIHTMLLDGTGDALRVFPAVSERWPDVEFHRLAAHGALEVSAVRTAGRTTRVELTATAATRLRLRDPFAPAAEVDWSHAVERTDDGLIILELQPGERLSGQLRSE